MIESFIIYYLLVSSLLFSNPSPELSFVDAGIQYSASKEKTQKKRLFITNRYFNIEKSRNRVGTPLMSG